MISEIASAPSQFPADDVSGAGVESNRPKIIGDNKDQPSEAKDDVESIRPEEFREVHYITSKGEE